MSIHVIFFPLKAISYQGPSESASLTHHPLPQQSPSTPHVISTPTGGNVLRGYSRRWFNSKMFFSRLKWCLPAMYWPEYHILLVHLLPDYTLQDYHIRLVNLAVILTQPTSCFSPLHKYHPPLPHPLRSTHDVICSPSSGNMPPVSLSGSNINLGFDIPASHLKISVGAGLQYAATWRWDRI